MKTRNSENLLILSSQYLGLPSHFTWLTGVSQCPSRRPEMTWNIIDLPWWQKALSYNLQGVPIYVPHSYLSWDLPTFSDCAFTASFNGLASHSRHSVVIIMLSQKSSDSRRLKAHSQSLLNQSWGMTSCLLKGNHFAWNLLKVPGQNPSVFLTQAFN